MTPALLLLKSPKVRVALVFGVCVACFSGALLLQNASLQAARLETKTIVAEHAKVDKTRAETFGREVLRIKKLGEDHADNQQRIIDALNIQLAHLQASRAADARQLDGVRRSLAAFSTPSRDRAPGETDAVAAQRFADRLAKLGTLADEGAVLVAEARGIVGRRDAEVAALKAVIENDRKACERFGG